MMKKICFLIVFLTACFLYGFSVNLYSITDGSGIPGDWSDGNFWSLSPGGPACNCTPAPSDNISIQEDINLDVDLTGGSAISGILTIEAGASLSTLTYDISIKSGATLNVYGTLEVFDLEFSNGSIIYTDESSTIIVHGDLTNKNNSDDVVLNGDVTITGEFYNGNGGIITGSGSITAGTFTGGGTTFGTIPNSSIPDDSIASEDPLPIELIYFSAELNNNKTVNIKWTTAVEINNSFFTIEKTRDGKTYEAVGVVPGSSNSNYVINYSLTDENPYFGISYYRLKQTDIDGRFSLSSIVVIRNNQQSTAQFNLYPNPTLVGQSSYVDIQGLESEKEVLVVVLNIMGQELYSKVIFTNTNGAAVEAIDPYNQLSCGTYIIIGTSDDRVYKKKLIIK